MKQKFYTLLFILIVSGLTLFFPLRLHKSLNSSSGNSESSVVSSTFYNDAFYYFAVADNYSKTGINSFDGKNPSNGYNFLWQKILNIAFLNIEDKNSQLEFVFLLCLLLSISANIILFLTVLKLTKERIFALFSIFPGFFYLIFSFGLGTHYSPWSVINGMESSLNLLVFSIFLFTSVQYIESRITGRNYYLLSSIILTILFLCRFDEIFLLMSFALFLLTSKNEGKWRNFLSFKIIPVLVFILYVSYNWFEFGLPLPVSGIVKSEFYPQNLIHVFNGLFSGRSFDFLAGVHLYSRLLPLLIPLIFVPLLSKFIIKKDSSGRWETVLKILSVYVIFKSSYILFFVDFWNQGQWYFFNQVVVLNILTIIAIKMYLPTVLKSRLLKLALILILVFFSHSYLLNYESNISDSDKINRNNISRIKLMIDKYLIDGKIIEMDDGIISYSSDNECLSGFGLAIDREGYEARNNGVLLDLAYKRGYRYIASVNYFKSPELIPNKIKSINDFVSVPFFTLDKENLSKWQFAPVVKDTESKLVVVYFNKK